MQLLRAILTPLCGRRCAGHCSAPLSRAQNRGDDTLLEMHQAFRKGDRKKLEQLLPAARGHALEPWAAYWELKLRLGEASPAEIQAFLKRYAGTYQEDRLRNDWLLLLGQRRDWAQFAEQHPSYRMSDDKGSALLRAADRYPERHCPGHGRRRGAPQLVRPARQR